MTSSKMTRPAKLVSFLKLALHDFITAYSYDNASLEVLEESRLMATDEFKQASIDFFDNKFSSLVPLKIAYFLRSVAHSISQPCLFPLKYIKLYHSLAWSHSFTKRQVRQIVHCWCCILYNISLRHESIILRKKS